MATIQINYRKIILALALISFPLVNMQPAVADELRANLVGGDKVTDFNDPVYMHSARLLIQGEIHSAQGVPSEVVGKTLSWRCSAAIVADRVLLTAAIACPKALISRMGGPSFTALPWKSKASRRFSDSIRATTSFGASVIRTTFGIPSFATTGTRSSGIPRIHQPL